MLSDPCLFCGRLYHKPESASRCGRAEAQPRSDMPGLIRHAVCCWMRSPNIAPLDAIQADPARCFVRPQPHASQGGGGKKNSKNILKPSPPSPPPHFALLICISACWFFLLPPHRKSLRLSQLLETLGWQPLRSVNALLAGI